MTPAELLERSQWDLFWLPADAAVFDQPEYLQVTCRRRAAYLNAVLRVRVGADRAAEVVAEAGARFEPGIGRFMVTDTWAAGPLVAALQAQGWQPGDQHDVRVLAVDRWVSRPGMEARAVTDMAGLRDCVAASTRAFGRPDTSTDAELAATRFQTRIALTDTRTLRFYYRLLPGNRLQIGSRSAITGADATDPRHLKLLTDAIARKFPAQRARTLLEAIDHPLARDRRAFEERYGQGHWREQGGRQIWQANGASHLEELQRLLRPLVLHRRKEQCLDLPPKRRLLLPVDLAEPSASRNERRLQACVDNYRSRAARGEVRRDAEALAVLTALRRIGSRAKLPRALALLQQLLSEDQGAAVVLFTAFVSSARLLHRALGGDGRAVLLTGAVPAAERQARVDRFQAGLAPVLIATYGTGGLGFTLHRARHVVLLERPWTPGDAEQAEDRCHRIGMGAMLSCHWLQLGLADQLVDGLIASKAERISLVFRSRQELLRRASLPVLVRELLDRW